MACSGAASSTLGWGETLPLASKGGGNGTAGAGDIPQPGKGPG